jgi:hypothetical protein
MKPKKKVHFADEQKPTAEGKDAAKGTIIEGSADFSTQVGVGEPSIMVYPRAKVRNLAPQPKPQPDQKLAVKKFVDRRWSYPHLAFERDPKFCVMLDQGTFYLYAGNMQAGLPAPSMRAL